MNTTENTTEPNDEKSLGSTSCSLIDKLLDVIIEDTGGPLEHNFVLTEQPIGFKALCLQTWVHGFTYQYLDGQTERLISKIVKSPQQN